MVKLDNNSRLLISRLESAGYPTYAVGGCVRDSLMNRKTDDYDLTTRATPDEIKAVLSDLRLIDTGIKHGTVTAVIDNKPYEITTFRRDVGSNDNRHPDSVEFLPDIESDLKRRDFTVNTIAYSPNNGLIDPFGGVDDINNKLLKTVGDPLSRFTEDYLRILRALRFSSTLGFEIEDNTKKAILAFSDNLLSVSRERLFSELCKLLLGDNAPDVLLEFKSALAPILPITGDLNKLNHLPRDLAFRFACVCGDKAPDALSFLKSDNSLKAKARLLCESVSIPDDYIGTKLWISKYNNSKIASDVALFRRLMYNEDINSSVDYLINEGNCLFVRDLDIKGDEILALGVPDYLVGNMLKALLESVIIGETENKNKSLKNKIPEIIGGFKA